MPFKTGLGRMSTVDFFASLPPGFYIFLALYTAIGRLPEGDGISFWSQIEPLVFRIEEHPALAGLVLFASYVLGSVVRTFPVDRAEQLVKLTRNKNIFPDEKELQKINLALKLKAAAAFIDATKLVDLERGVSVALFNYWKDSLSVKAPEALAYYERFEARSRFFAGMFWAGLAGLLASIWTFTPFSHLSSQGALDVLAFSLVLIASFGLGLPRVRKQEVGVLLMLFTALHQEGSGKLRRPNKRIKLTGGNGYA